MILAMQCMHYVCWYRITICWLNISNVWLFTLDKKYKLLLLLGYLFIIDKFDNPVTAYGLLVRHIIFIIEFEYTCLNLHL